MEFSRKLNVAVKTQVRGYKDEIVKEGDFVLYQVMNIFFRECGRKSIAFNEYMKNLNFQLYFGDNTTKMCD